MKTFSTVLAKLIENMKNLSTVLEKSTSVIQSCSSSNPVNPDSDKKGMKNIKTNS
jgi:hypothetical protein